MRYLPHTLYLMSLRGRKTLHGRRLPSPAEAANGLRKITGQDFGQDARTWAAWIKTNRVKLYKSPPPG